ncbi:signal peptidase I [Tepidanaerobacter sp. EBM-38]|uniref:signal peptidase I n=1 Tax=Tepidanaerobacter sp. EBM-38 TaxID=1918496 RepID=UPI000A58534A|nr:signal peptidase I [Tepidanaerobacter sp. EBM-38]
MKMHVSYRIMDLLMKTILILLTLVALSLLFFLVQSKVSGRVPSIGGYQMYIVMSGSMNPAVKTGSLVIVKPLDPEEIRPKDIITFKSEIESENITTHRVVEIDKSAELFFRTRGDANEVDDPMPVSASQVIGKVVYSIPYAGFAFHFIRSQNGIITLLVVFIIFISAELIKTLWVERKKNKQKIEKNMEVVIKEDV